ncbi:PfkB family carbohydrate kinase [Halalkalibacter sp. AB-rgal2]|uniref:PfkB family carbohydrate kinase n=1 Tax=Halalkalibacter sp. AB-rgal2 TaxID=3242695 RepID=UPI00359E775B
MKKVVTLGEILLRLSPPGHDRISGSQSFDAIYGGSEGNVAVALQSFGLQTSLVSKIPAHAIGDAAIQSFNAYGVDTSHIIRGGERLGTYFLENGYSIRSSKVVYDRKHSAISEAQIEEFDLDAVFDGAELFHVSGITLGISEQAFRLSQAFMEEAARRKIPVSFDFNYRAKLWSTNEAKSKFLQVLPYVDVAFAGFLDFTTFLGLDHALVEVAEIEDYQKIYKTINETFGFQYIVSSFRDVISASKNDYQGLVYNGTSEEVSLSKKYSIDIIDRVGAGDAFTAGFLYSYLLNKDDLYKVEFSTAAAAIKHTIFGDSLKVNVEEVESVFQSGAFHVQR